MRGRLIAIAAAMLLAVANAGVEAQELKTATFAGGCFWCVESDFDHVPGVVKTISGYTGGMLPNPYLQAGCLRRNEASRGRPNHLRSKPGQLCGTVDRILALDRSHRSRWPVL